MRLGTKRDLTERSLRMMSAPLKMALLLVFLIIIGVPFSVYGQRDKVLHEPIVEGKSMFGIKLGDSESDIYKTLGSPDEIRSNFMDIPPDVGKLKMLTYVLNGDTSFAIFIRNAKVDVIDIVWSEEGIAAYKGKTTKGIGLGDPIERVKKYYGKCEMRKELCWHRKYGIAFDGAKVVSLILIASPGELPAYLLTKQHSGAKNILTNHSRGMRRNCCTS